MALVSAACCGKKHAIDITGFTTNDINRSMAVSGNYLVLSLSSTPSTYKIYDRKTGAYVQDMVAPPGGSAQFCHCERFSRSHPGLLHGRLKNSAFYVYKYNDPFDANPVKLVQWTNNNPNGIAGDGGVGRRINVCGDVNKNAVLAATAGVSNVVYNWQVVNGAVVNNTPAPIAYSIGNWRCYLVVLRRSATHIGNCQWRLLCELRCRDSAGKWKPIIVAL